MPPSSHKTLRETALETNKTNPSQLGDPISLKAETSDTLPTDQDRGATSTSSSIDVKNSSPSPADGNADGKIVNARHKTLRQRAMEQENPSQLGDPVSLKAEKVDSEPTEHDRGSRGTGGNSKL